MSFYYDKIEEERMLSSKECKYIDPETNQKCYDFTNNFLNGLCIFHQTEDELQKNSYFVSLNQRVGPIGKFHNDKFSFAATFHHGMFQQYTYSPPHLTSKLQFERAQIFESCFDNDDTDNSLVLFQFNPPTNPKHEIADFIEQRVGNYIEYPKELASEHFKKELTCLCKFHWFMIDINDKEEVMFIKKISETRIFLDFLVNSKISNMQISSKNENKIRVYHPFFSNLQYEKVEIQMTKYEMLNFMKILIEYYGKNVLFNISEMFIFPSTRFEFLEENRRRQQLINMDCNCTSILVFIEHLFVFTFILLKKHISIQRKYTIKDLENCKDLCKFINSVEEKGVTLSEISKKYGKSIKEEFPIINTDSFNYCLEKIPNCYRTTVNCTYFCSSLFYLDIPINERKKQLSMFADKEQYFSIVAVRIFCN